MADPNYVLVESSIDVADVFSNDQATAWQKSTANLAQHFVRRPLRGLRIKKETFATLSVQGPGELPTLANSSVSEGYQAHFTSNFILTGVQETRSEKFQPLTTFGSTYGFFYGEQPRMMTFQGILLNTADFQWEVEWWENYEQYFRGTRLTDRGLRAYMSFDDTIVECYLITAATSKNAAKPYEVDLTFTAWVTNITYLVTAGEKSVSARHLTPGSLALELDDGFDTISSRGDQLEAESLTAEVRKRNIEAITSSDIGLIAALRNGLDAVTDFVDQVGNVIDNVVDFLYGRNMVIPAGFAGSERTAGTAVFASGSGFENLSVASLGGGVLSGSSLNISVPGVITGVAPSPSAFYDNVDEYPARSSETRLTRADADSALRAMFGVGLSGTSRDEQNQMYVGLAEATFSGFGYNITNESGQQTSELLRTLGRVGYAALSYTAMTSGVSQSAASLTVIGGTTGNTDAAEQQAALEESSS